MIVAIDGTTASGKGTLARRLAAAYGWPHLDTGLLYRAVGAAVKAAGGDPANPAEAAAAARGIRPDHLEAPQLRTAEAGALASVVAAHPPVREALVDLQRRFALQPGGAVLDGRDIGAVIAPFADVKLWIDAAIEERAHRRWLELAARGDTVGEAEVLAQLRERDARDRTRAAAPALPAADAVRIDTTDLSPELVFTAARLVVEVRLALPQAPA